MNTISGKRKFDPPTVSASSQIAHPSSDGQSLLKRVKFTEKNDSSDSLQNHTFEEIKSQFRIKIGNFLEFVTCVAATLDQMGKKDSSAKVNLLGQNIQDRIEQCTTSQELDKIDQGKELRLYKRLKNLDKTDLKSLRASEIVTSGIEFIDFSIIKCLQRYKEAKKLDDQNEKDNAFNEISTKMVRKGIYFSKSIKMATEIKHLTFRNDALRAIGKHFLKQESYQECLDLFPHFEGNLDTMMPLFVRKLTEDVCFEVNLEEPPTALRFVISIPDLEVRNTVLKKVYTQLKMDEEDVEMAESDVPLPSMDEIYQFLIKTILPHFTSSAFFKDKKWNPIEELAVKMARRIDDEKVREEALTLVSAIFEDRAKIVEIEKIKCKDPEKALNLASTFLDQKIKEALFRRILTAVVENKELENSEILAKKIWDLTFNEKIKKKMVPALFSLLNAKGKTDEIKQIILQHKDQPVISNLLYKMFLTLGNINQEMAQDFAHECDDMENLQSNAFLALSIIHAKNSDIVPAYHSAMKIKCQILKECALVTVCALPAESETDENTLVKKALLIMAYENIRDEKRKSTAYANLKGSNPDIDISP